MRLFLLSALIAFTFAWTVDYEGHRVLRVLPETESQLAWLKALDNKTHSYEDYDFWLEPRAVGRPVDIRVAPLYMEKMYNYIHEGGMQYKATIPDLQTHFKEARAPGDGTWDTEYHSFDDITNWMKAAAAANPSFVSLVTIGESYEKRTFYGLKISKANSTANPPVIYLDGGIHAREWLAPAVVEYLIGQFVNDSTNATINKYLQAIEWYFVPVFNPDGYVYTFETDPNWRKNRQPNGDNPCIGTDMCRNAATGFGGEGSSSSACSDTYHGAAAWSAPETAAFRDYVTALKNLKGYVNFHSYAESWLDNFGYTATLPKDYAAQEANAKAATTAIKNVHGQTYSYGPAYTTIYPASGIESDWTYAQLGVIYSQAIELRGNSFQPPPSIIVPTGEEIIAGMFVLADSVLAL